MVWSQSYSGIPRITEYHSLCRGVYTDETCFSNQHVDRCSCGWHSAIDGVGCCCWPERNGERRLARVVIGAREYRRVAAGRASLCMAIPSLQRSQLAYSGGVQECRVSHVGLDQLEDERPSGSTILAPTRTTMFWFDLLRRY